MDKATQSKERMSEAVMRLLKTNTYDSITIQMITDEAEVSRMAFYRNFGGKDDIIRYYIDKQADEFVKSSQLEFGTEFSDLYFCRLVDYLSKVREIGLMLIGAGLFDLMREEFDRIYTSLASGTQDRLRYYFIAGGICNVYYYWLVSGCRESPEELADTLKRVLRQLYR